MGTITTYSRAAVKGNEGHAGTKEDVVNSIYRWCIKRRKLIYQAKGYPEQEGFSYNEEWSEDEIRKDAVEYLFNILGLYGWRTFRDIGF